MDVVERRVEVVRQNGRRISRDEGRTWLDGGTTVRDKVEAKHEKAGQIETETVERIGDVVEQNDERTGETAEGTVGREEQTGKG